MAIVGGYRGSLAQRQHQTFAVSLRAQRPDCVADHSSAAKWQRLLSAPSRHRSTSALRRLDRQAVGWHSHNEWRSDEGRATSDAWSCCHLPPNPIRNDTAAEKRRVADCSLPPLRQQRQSVDRPRRISPHRDTRPRVSSAQWSTESRSGANSREQRDDVYIARQQQQHMRDRSESSFSSTAPNDEVRYVEKTSGIDTRGRRHQRQGHDVANRSNAESTSTRHTRSATAAAGGRSSIKKFTFGDDSIANDVESTAHQRRTTAHVRSQTQDRTQDCRVSCRSRGSSQTQDRTQDSRVSCRSRGSYERQSSPRLRRSSSSISSCGSIDTVKRLLHSSGTRLNKLMGSIADVTNATRSIALPSTANDSRIVIRGPQQQTSSLRAPSSQGTAAEHLTAGRQPSPSRSSKVGLPCAANQSCELDQFRHRVAELRSLSAPSRTSILQRRDCSAAQSPANRSRMPPVVDSHSQSCDPENIKKFGILRQTVQKGTVPASLDASQNVAFLTAEPRSVLERSPETARCANAAMRYHRILSRESQMHGMSPPVVDEFGEEEKLGVEELGISAGERTRFRIALGEAFRRVEARVAGWSAALPLPVRYEVLHSTTFESKFVVLRDEVIRLTAIVAALQNQLANTIESSPPEALLEEISSELSEVQRKLLLFEFNQANITASTCDTVSPSCVA